MNNYEIRTNKKKSAIIATASALFKRDGFVNVSIKDIASNASVSQVSIYNYFGSKDALVGECVKNIMIDIINKAREILHSNLSFNEKILQAVSLCSHDINTSLYSYFSEEALNDKTLIKLISDFINKEKLKLFREYIEEGKKAGDINNSISTDSILTFIETLSISNTTSFNVNYLNDIQHLILYGILGKK